MSTIYDRRALTALAEISQTLIQLQPLEHLGQAVIQVMERLLHYEYGAVLLVGDHGEMVPLALSDQGKGPDFVERDKAYVQSHGLCVGQGITGWVAQHGQSVRTGDVSTDARYHAMRTGIQSELCVPIMYGAEIVGVLNIETPRPDAYSEVDQMVLEAIASQIGIAIHNARLYDQLRNHAHSLERDVGVRTHALARAITQLEQEVNERQRAEEALRQYAEELERRNEELDAFAHSVAHELKNPVGIVLGYSALLPTLCDGLPEELVAEGQAWAEQISLAGEKMLGIIDSLLLLASVRMKTFTTEPLDMAAIISMVREHLSGLLQKYDATLIEADTWPRAMGYSPWVEAVWSNYISNAAKYGGKPPVIRVGADALPDGTVRFWVRDNGQGLPREMQEQVYMPFVRLKPGDVPGHGLGLSIVRRIIERLDGDVAVESEVGQGSTFSFTLPACVDERR